MFGGLRVAVGVPVERAATSPDAVINTAIERFLYPGRASGGKLGEAPILYNCFCCYKKGGKMANLSSALQELRAERNRAQSQVEKLDQAILVIESLNGTGTSGKTNQPARVISAASRRKMARAQKARWANARKSPQSTVGTAKAASATPAKRTLSVAARKKIAAAQKARWAKVKAAKKAA